MNRTLTSKAKRKPKTTFIEEARRRQILDIALDEITAKGYRNTSVQEIANKANITHPACLNLSTCFIGFLLFKSERCDQHTLQTQTLRVRIPEAPL